MPKMIIMPPQSEQTVHWASELANAVPEFAVALPETDEDAKREIADADAALGKIPPEALADAKKLQWLHSLQAGPTAGYYYSELVEHPVTITNPRGVYNDHIAQHIMMYVLALSRGLPYYMDAQHNRRWDKQARKSKYIDLKTATALIVGLGGIGQETAKLCNAFGMRVIGTDARYEYDDIPNVEKHAPEKLDELIPAADFVITTTPHTPETEGMWHADRFKLMKPTAYFVNIGRGATTKIADLTQALQDGILAGCALDVYETEPFPEDHILWTLPNVILTPHIAVHEAEDVPARQLEVFINNARRFAAGESLNNVVDKTMWF
ncbi:MAG: D-2-hydroxyacid dehydrogenase [Chloroflexota bacterium]